MSSELSKVGYLKIMGIAVAAFLLGFGAFKGTLEILNLDTVSETEINKLREKEKQLEELKNRPTTEEYEIVKKKLTETEKRLESWEKAHAAWIFKEKELKKAWVEIYEHDTFRGRSVRFLYGQNNPNFHSIRFDNKGSSAKWNIPVGYRAVLYGDNTYHGSQLIFEGTGNERSISNFEDHHVGDQGSSLRWEKSP